MAFAIAFVAAGGGADADTTGPYGLDLRPVFLLRNLATYVRWSVTVLPPWPNEVSGLPSALKRMTAKSELIFGVVVMAYPAAIILPSGRRNSSTPWRRASLRRWHSLCAIMIGSGISSGVSSQA